jgi:PDZ domain-containing protein
MSFIRSDDVYAPAVSDAVAPTGAELTRTLKAGRRSTRAKLLSVTAPLTALLGAAAVLLPTGFAIRAPGPTEDTLGSQMIGGRSVPLVEIAGAPTFDATGQLRLTTVSVAGGPIGAVMPMDVVFSWFSPRRSVTPVEAVFPTGITREQQQQQSAAQMVSSQEAATAAALSELGFDIPMTMSVAGFPDDSQAEGVLELGDILMEVNEVPQVSFAGLLDTLGQIPPGSEVTLTVRRHGEVLEIPLTTGEATNADGSTRAALGVLMNSEFDFPIDVTIQIENIGGPSAGSMFALAIIDRLTEVDELQGVPVAGTGAINADGQILPIGGIRQKMFGAVRDGVQWFLAPTTNCDEVVGSVPAGLNVVAVSNLHEAHNAITAIGQGQGNTLPTCTT